MHEEYKKFGEVPFNLETRVLIRVGLHIYSCVRKVIRDVTSVGHQANDLSEITIIRVMERIAMVFDWQLISTDQTICLKTKILKGDVNTTADLSFIFELSIL